MPLPSGNDPRELPRVRELGWNWGGFLVPYLWLLGHGRVTLGMLLLLSTAVPFFSLVHFLVYPATGIYLGLNGYEVAWRHAPHHTVEQLRSRESEWTLWGFLVVAFVVVAAFFFFVYFAAMMGEMWNELGGLG